MGALASGLALTLIGNARMYGHPFGPESMQRVHRSDLRLATLRVHVARLPFLLAGVPALWSDAARDSVQRAADRLAEGTGATTALRGERRVGWPGAFLPRVPRLDERFSLTAVFGLAAMAWTLVQWWKRRRRPRVWPPGTIVVVTATLGLAIVLFLRWQAGAGLPDRFLIPLLAPAAALVAYAVFALRRATVVMAAFVVLLAWSVIPGTVQVARATRQALTEPARPPGRVGLFADAAAALPEGARVLLVSNQNSGDYVLFAPEHGFSNVVLPWGQGPFDAAVLRDLIAHERLTHVLVENADVVDFHWGGTLRTRELVGEVEARPGAMRIALPDPAMRLFALDSTAGRHPLRSAVPHGDDVAGQNGPLPENFDRLLRRLGRGLRLPAEKPFRDELLSIERLEERAKALAARFTVDPTRGARRATSFPRLDENARVLREAYRTLADDVHRGAVRHRRPPSGCSTTSTWSTSEIRDVRQNLPARLLPRAADARRARAGGARAHLRDGGRAHPPQRQPARPPAAGALHQQLPDGRAAHHRRALGVAEHAEAGADREPAPAGRRDRSSARRAPAPPTPTWRASTRGQGRLPPLAADAAHRLRRAAAAAHARVRPAAGRRCATASTTHLAAQQTDVEDAIRSEHQRQAAAQVSVANVDHQPAALLDPGLEPVLRGGEPGRAGPAARPGRRLRADGLPEPRPLPPGGRGAGRAHRRGAGARGAARGGERAPGRRAPGSVPTARRTSATT